MREILFRGKQVGNDKWVEGGHYENKTGKYIISPAFVAHLIIPETVSQFTGLTDRNGVKIFEGDIIRWHDDTELSVSGQIAEVCFGKYKDADSAFDDIYPLGFYIRFSDKNCITICWLDEYKNCFDIVGNIYDNPELLNEGET